MKKVSLLRIYSKKIRVILHNVCEKLVIKRKWDWFLSCKCGEPLIFWSYTDCRQHSLHAWREKILNMKLSSCLLAYWDKMWVIHASMINTIYERKRYASCISFSFLFLFIYTASVFIHSTSNSTVRRRYFRVSITSNAHLTIRTPFSERMFPRQWLELHTYFYKLSLILNL